VAADIVIRFVGDASQAIAVTKQVEDAHKSMAQSMIRTGAAITAGVTLPIVAMGAVAFKEFEEAGKVAAQTNAVLRSTGEIAGVSAKQVDDLANSMLHKTGIDDEAIKSGENMLLTFTNIRNEAGKGNDVFTQATKITADLSVAFGKDMTESAILVGKALQDPVAGMAALQRVGVRLSAQQQQQVRDFAAVGDIASAQKVILKELTTEVGGSANAFGKTMAGQLQIAKQEMLNAGAAIIMVLAPSLKVLAEVAQSVAGAIQSLPHGLQIAIGVMGLLAAAVGPAMTAIGGLMTILPKLGSAFVTLGLDIAAFIERTSFAAFAMNPIVLGLAAAAVVIGVVLAVVGRSANVWDEAQASAKAWGETVVAAAKASGDELNFLRSEQEAFNTEARATAAQGDLTFEQVLKLKARQDELGGAVHAAAQAHRDAQAAEEQRRIALQNLTTGTQQSTDATLAAVSALQQYANQVLANQGGQVGYQAALLAQQSAQDRVNQSIADNGPFSLATATAQNQLEAATLAVSAAAIKASTDHDTFTATLNQDAVPGLQAMRQALINTALAHDGNTVAVDAEIAKIDSYIATAQAIPPQATTRVEADTAEAQRKVDAYLATLYRIQQATNALSQAFVAAGGSGQGEFVVPGGAAGGIVRRPTLAMIGEAGPEALIPLHRMPGVSSLASGARAFAGGGTSNTFNINVSVAQGVNPADVGAATVDAIRAYERLNGKSWRN
jgi:hypothetical protein